MAFYEAQSWQVPARTGSWEQPPPPSRSSMRWQNYPRMAFPDCVSGTNSVMQREDTSAFDMQIEGKLETCYGGNKWQYKNRIVISSVLLEKDVRASSMSSTDRISGARYFWTSLGWIFSLEQHSARLGNTVFGPFLIYSLTEIDRALDNLNKSGKLFNTPLRRESMPMVGAPRPFPEFGNISNH